MKSVEETINERRGKETYYFGGKEFIPKSIAMAAMEEYASQFALPTEEEIGIIISTIEAMHPYKQRGDRNSYTEYAEGWSDACDILGNAILSRLNQKETKTE